MWTSARQSTVQWTGRNAQGRSTSQETCLFTAFTLLRELGRKRGENEKDLLFRQALYLCFGRVCALFRSLMIFFALIPSFNWKDGFFVEGFVMISG
ncbi:hypothetical protein SD77_3793 [Bacillus badius]|uniref:Uncharacterized protein n=1 Tax=Bacillus badius TaxID=1455 RepID=A0ABR5AW70_BACBA|nr:hypothetical protein SD78_1591 [Bacillus badius]KIL78992.1 hypothetical protein SD77_3793 [Bacillus badius]